MNTADINRYFKKRRKLRKRDIADGIVTHVILLAVCAIFLFPCLWLVLSSFSANGSIYGTNGFFPKSYSFNTFKMLFTDTMMYNYPRWFLNTLYVSILSSILSTLLVILTAYTMSRFHFKSRRAMMKITLVLGMFPSFMGMTAVYMLMVQFNLVNRLSALILIYSAGAPMGYLVQKGFFDTIPNTIYDAARIDGASNAKIFITMTLPMSKPILVYTLLTSFTWPWSDFILPKLLLTTNDIYTVAVGLMAMPETEFPRFAAGAVFIAVPIVVLYFCLVKYLVSGLSAGAVKE